MSDSIVTIRDLCKTFRQGGKERRVLDCVNLEIHRGEFFVLLGKSGSGKSTLGPIVANVLGYDFIDLDEWVEDQAGIVRGCADGEGGDGYL